MKKISKKIFLILYFIGRNQLFSLMKIIIPMAGNSKRFSDAGYKLPKFF